MDATVEVAVMTVAATMVGSVVLTAIISSLFGVRHLFNTVATSTRRLHRQGRSSMSAVPGDTNSFNKGGATASV